MDPRRFLCAALLASCFIWYLNVYRYRHPPASGSQMVVEAGKFHILVTGGAGFIASHAALLLLEQGHAVTIVDNMSRGNMGALAQLSSLHPPSKFKFLLVDLGNSEDVKTVLLRAKPRPDLVMHFAAIAYVGGCTCMNAGAAFMNHDGAVFIKMPHLYRRVRCQSPTVL